MIPNPYEVAAEPRLRLAADLAAKLGGVPRRMIGGAHRGSRPAAQARQLAFYLARIDLGMSAAAVSSGLRRDVSTVAHGCRCVEDRRDDHRFDLAVAMVERGLARLLELSRREEI
jgi:hypothetical protein